LQDNSRWPNPIVLKITHVTPKFTAPRVETGDVAFDRATRTATLSGTLLDLGKTSSVEVGFEYRSIVGLDASDRSIPWHAVSTTTLTAPGSFSVKLPNLDPEGVYEYRSWVKHPLLTIFGAEKRVPKP